MPVVLPFETVEQLFPGYTLETQLKPQRYIDEGDDEIFAYTVQGMGQDGRKLDVSATGHIWHVGPDDMPVQLGGVIAQVFLEDKGDSTPDGKRGLTVMGFFDMRAEKVQWLPLEKVQNVFTSNRSAAKGMLDAINQIITLAGMSHIPGERPFAIECFTATPPADCDMPMLAQAEIDRNARVTEMYADLLFPQEAVATVRGTVQRVLAERRAKQGVPDAPGYESAFSPAADVTFPVRTDLEHGKAAPGGGATVLLFGRQPGK